MKIVILERNSVGMDVDVSMFSDFGELISYENTKKEEIRERVKEADIIIANKSLLNEETIGEAKNVKLICQFATGYDNVDLNYCKKKGIKVANTVDYCTETVAQHTFALAFYILEKLNYYDQFVKSGEYAKSGRFTNFDKMFTEICGKTWGIAGMGNIGKKVAKIAQAFGCRVIFYSTSGKSVCRDYRQVDFDTLLAESDILSLHCPLTETTRNLIRLDAMKKMKKSALLINVARGAVINNADLYTALMEGEIAGAGLDVVEKEPITEDNPLAKIKDSGKLIITPHIGWASVEARTRCVEEAYKNVEAFLRGEDRNIVNIL